MCDLQSVPTVSKKSEYIASLTRNDGERIEERLLREGRLIEKKKE